MNTTTTIEKMIDSIAAVCIDLGLRGGYTPEEITDLVCDIAFAHMYDALRDRAETVYAYSTDGDRSMTLKYRSRKLFDREAMLLWREPVVCVDETEVASSRYLELWLLEDMSVAVVSCVQIVFPVLTNQMEAARPGRPISRTWAGILRGTAVLPMRMNHCTALSLGGTTVPAPVVTPLTGM